MKFTMGDRQSDHAQFHATHTAVSLLFLLLGTEGGKAASHRGTLTTPPSICVSYIIHSKHAIPANH